MDLFPVSPGKFWFSLVQNQTYSLCFFSLFSLSIGVQKTKKEIGPIQMFLIPFCMTSSWLRMMDRSLSILMSVWGRTGRAVHNLC